MLEELKKIKIAEIDWEISILQEQISKEYTWLEIKITKSKEYQDYIENIPIIREKIYRLNNQKEKYRNALTLQQLGLTFNAAILLLESHNIKPIMNKNDLETYEHNIPYHELTSTKDIIYVCKGNYLPHNNRIASVKELYNTTGFELREDIKNSNPEIITHFSANGEIRNNPEENRNAEKYALLIPFSEMPKENIVQAECYDTYTNGTIRLTNNTFLLVPLGEGQTVKKDNPEITVIEYNDSCVTGYANSLISIMGYNRYNVGPNKWTILPYDDKEKYDNLMEKEGLSINKQVND